MSEESKALVPVDLNPLVPTKTARDRLAEIRQFVKEELREGLDADYAVIPGTGRKPSLLQPGAEKLCEKLGLAPSFEARFAHEDTTRGEYIVDVLCQLVSPQTGQVWAQSWGSAARSAQEDLDAANIYATRNNKPHRNLTFRDIGLARNTAVKMAQKSALVGAVLKAARLAVDFTQDIEDMAPPRKPDQGSSPPAKPSRAEPPIETTSRAPDGPLSPGAQPAKRDPYANLAPGVKEVLVLRDQVGMSPKDFADYAREKVGMGDPNRMSDQQRADIIALLQDKIAEENKE